MSLKKFQLTQPEVQVSAYWRLARQPSKPSRFPVVEQQVEHSAEPAPEQPERAQLELPAEQTHLLVASSTRDSIPPLPIVEAKLLEEEKN